MNIFTSIRRNRRVGVVFTIIFISILVIFLAKVIEDYFDYRINDTTIAAIIAALSLLYEINKSKKLNEAEFLVNLNNIFITNNDYKKIYDALSNYDFDSEPCLSKEITNSEISNYLTLFETFYILLARKVIDLKFLNDLFAYRFFSAVHNPFIQRTKIICSPRNFKNIYRLERLWNKYRKNHDNNDYYFSESYHLIYRTPLNEYLKSFNYFQQRSIIKSLKVKRLKDKDNFKFKSISDVNYLDRIYKMQNEAVLASNKIKKGMLRLNSKDMLKTCLTSPHDAIGIFHNDNLIGFGILFDPSADDSESIKKSLNLEKHEKIALVEESDIIHIKLVVIDKEYQGKNLQYHMNKQLEELAIQKNKKLLLTTISPFNIPSIKNTYKAGFTYVDTVIKYDNSARLVYAKFIK